MPLKFETPSLEGIDQAYHSLYVKEGDVYRLQVEGAVSSTKLGEFRDNNIALKQELEKFKGIDPTKHAELLKLEQQVTDKKLLDAGKVEELVAGRIGTMKSEYETQIRERDEKLSSSNRQLESLLIDSAVRTAANPAEGPQVLSTAIDDVLLRAKTVFRIVDSVATPIGPDGKVVYGANGVDPMSITEWMKGLQKNAPHLFAGNKGGGAPSRVDRTGDTSKMSSIQKISAGLGG